MIFLSLFSSLIIECNAPDTVRTTRTRTYSLDRERERGRACTKVLQSRRSAIVCFKDRSQHHGSSRRRLIFSWKEYCPTHWCIRYKEGHPPPNKKREQSSNSSSLLRSFFFSHAGCCSCQFLSNSTSCGVVVVCFFL